MKYGAVDFLVKPLNNNKLIEDIHHFAKLKQSGGIGNESVKMVMKSKIIERVVE